MAALVTEVVILVGEGIRPVNKLKQPLANLHKVAPARSPLKLKRGIFLISPFCKVSIGIFTQCLDFGINLLKIYFSSDALALTINY